MSSLGEKFWGDLLVAFQDLNVATRNTGRDFYEGLERQEKGELVKTWEILVGYEEGRRPSSFRCRGIHSGRSLFPLFPSFSCQPGIVAGSSRKQNSPAPGKLRSAGVGRIFHSDGAD